MATGLEKGSTTFGLNPIRFGVQVTPGLRANELQQEARAAESLGYSTIYLPDHFGGELGPLVGMTLAATATTTLRVGSLVLANDFRHPAVVAKEIATLDRATEGRVEVGLGAGWLRADYERSGLPHSSAAERVGRLAEAVKVMKLLWGPGPADFAGRYYGIRDLDGQPKPHSKPHPRLVIGGGGRKILSMAAREADIVGVNASLCSGELTNEVFRSIARHRYEERLGWVRAAATERQRELELQCLCYLVRVTPGRERLAYALARRFRVSVDDVLDAPPVLIGTAEEIAATLRQRSQTLGITYWVVHDRDMKAMAPVVQALRGLRLERWPTG